MLYKDKDAAQFREARAASPIRFVVIHTIYLINLATTNEDFYEKSVTSLVGAVVAAEQLGADAIVTHVGWHQGAGFAAGLERVRVALGRALEQAADSPVRVLLENTAGAGGTMGVDFERARGHDRRCRRRPARGHLPGHVPPVRRRLRHPHPAKGWTEWSRRSTAPVASNASSCCTSTTP